MQIIFTRKEFASIKDTVLNYMFKIDSGKFNRNANKTIEELAALRPESLQVVEDKVIVTIKEENVLGVSKIMDDHSSTLTGLLMTCYSIGMMLSGVANAIKRDLKKLINKEKDGLQE